MMASVPGSRYRIPLFDLSYDDAEDAALRETLCSRWISMGPKTAELEARFAAALDVPHALAVTSGTAALHLALRVLDLGPGDEVIVPSLTFVATANAIRYVGATPIFCDIAGAHDLTLDPAALETLRTPRTKAVVVMHYGGFPCAMEAILAFARRHRLAVVEDAAHALLSAYRGRALGTLGDVGCFSFFANKTLATGEGGMLVTHDPRYHERARLLRSHGMTSPSYERAMGHATDYDVVEIGYNYRLDDLRASLGLVQLSKLPRDRERRAAVRARYLERLAAIDGIGIPFAGQQEPVSNYIFPIVLDRPPRVRDAVREALHAASIQTSVHYPAVHRFRAYGAGALCLPHTEHVADRVITLPMHGGLTAGDVDEVANTLRRALE